jgi:hypothetical protein
MLLFLLLPLPALALALPVFACAVACSFSVIPHPEQSSNGGRIRCERLFLATGYFFESKSPPSFRPKRLTHWGAAEWRNLFLYFNFHPSLRRSLESPEPPSPSLHLIERGVGNLTG